MRNPACRFARLVVLAVVAGGLGGCGADTAAMDAGAPAASKPAPARELRIITYNIRSFEGYVADEKWERANRAVKLGQMIARMAMELELYAPDLICLQEVPSEASAAELAGRLGMHYCHFQGGWKSKGWPEGISGAVLSKYPIVESRPHPSLNWTRRPEDLFTRYWGRAVIDSPYGRLVVHAMHGYHAKPEIRLRELDEVLPIVKKDVESGASVILAGDLNHTPDSAEHAKIAAAGMKDSFAGQPAGPELFTIPSTTRRERIDYIWSAGPISNRLKSARVLFEGAFRTNPEDPQSFALSDHVPVLAVFGMGN